MAVDPNYFGIDDFAFPVGSGSVCDYPAEGSVKSGVSYGSGAYTGTYGAGANPATHHSPADVLRWALINLGILGMPNDSSAVWTGWAHYEPDRPDELVTLYDTQGMDDGREMNSGVLYCHHGIQVRIRSVTSPSGWEKAEQIRTSLSQTIKLTTVTIDGQVYLIQAVTAIGQTIPLGREVPTAKGRYVFTINAKLSLKKV